MNAFTPPAHLLAGPLPCFLEYLTQASRQAPTSSYERHLAAQAYLKLAEADLLAHQILSHRNATAYSLGTSYPSLSPTSPPITTPTLSTSSFGLNIPYLGMGYTPPFDMQFRGQCPHGQYDGSPIYHSQCPPTCYEGDSPNQALGEIESMFVDLKRHFHFPHEVDFAPTASSLNVGQQACMDVLEVSVRNQRIFIYERTLQDLLTWLSLVKTKGLGGMVDIRRSSLADQVNNELEALYKESAARWRIYRANRVNTIPREDAGKHKREQFDALRRDLGISQTRHQTNGIPNNSTKDAFSAIPCPPSRIGPKGVFDEWQAPQVAGQKSKSASPSPPKGRISSSVTVEGIQDPFTVRGDFSKHNARGAPKSSLQHSQNIPFGVKAPPLRDGTLLNRELAERFQAYCREQLQLEPEIKFVDPTEGSPTALWTAIMFIEGSHACGQGSSKEDAEIACYLEMANKWEESDSETWEGFKSSNLEELEADETF